MSPLRILTIENGIFAENCYLLHEDGSPDAVIIDPGERTDLFLKEVTERSLTIRQIWITHAHLDHVAGVAAIKAATSAPVFLHPKDRRLYDAAPLQASRFGFELDPPPVPDRLLEAGETLAFGPHRFMVRHVPGHSPGSVVFIGEGLVFSGDVLFQGSIGRTDLPGGDFEQLIEGIRRDLLVLPDATVVYPGHGPPTSIGSERLHNPYLR